LPVPLEQGMSVQVFGCLLVTVLALVPGCSSRAPEDSGQASDRLQLARDRLAHLAGCGMVLNPGVRAEDLVDALDPAETAARQYLALLAAMGSPMDRDQQPFPSDSVLTLELDGIEKRGDYAFIVGRLRALARGRLPLTRIEDYVSLQRRKAWVAFDLGKRRYKWEVRVNGTQVDQDILVKVADLLKRKNSEVRFLSVGLGGGRVLIGCATSQEMRCLRDLGVPARWLR